MLKKLTLLVMILLGVTAVARVAPAAQAQTPAQTLQLLAIDLWPDFDRPSMLVLLTGTLPAGTPLPAEVTIPMTPGAELNAVARIDANNSMRDDVEYTLGTDSVTLITSDLRFRVEYYAPYETAGDTRSFRFDWLSDLAVEQATTVIQQPLAAPGIDIDPPPVNSAADRGDGMNYHTLAAQPIPAGERFVVDVSYDMPEPELSASVLPSGQEQSTAPEPAVPTPVEEGINWPLILAVAGGLLVVSAVTWQVATSRSRSKRVVKPRPERSEAPRPKAKPPTPPHSSQAKFCHNCGQPTTAGDQFCRSCGTKLK